jgi:NTE family protein
VKGSSDLIATDRPRVAFVLSGGGNQCVSQVGMLRALIERGIVPDVVIGTSAGALNGSAVATNPTLDGVAHIEDVWLSIRTGQVFPGNRFAQAWNVLTRDDHLFENDGLREVIAMANPAPTFDQMKVRFRVIATDLLSGNEVVFCAGPVEPALLGSAAIPGLFPPIVHGGLTVIDGAVTNNVPLWHAFAGPVDQVFVCNVSGGPAERRLKSPFDIAVRAFAIARNQRFELELRHAPPGVEVIVLPQPRDDRDLFDFSDSHMLIEEAHHLAERALDKRELARATAPRPAEEKARRRWFRRSRVA